MIIHKSVARTVCRCFSSICRGFVTKPKASHFWKYFYCILSILDRISFGLPRILCGAILCWMVCLNFERLERFNSVKKCFINYFNHLLDRFIGRLIEGYRTCMVLRESTGDTDRWITRWFSWGGDRNLDPAIQGHGRFLFQVSRLAIMSVGMMERRTGAASQL